MRALLGVDQELGQRTRLPAPSELADALGAIEVGEHQDVEGLRAGSGTEFELGIVEQRYNAVKEVVGGKGP